MTDTNITNSSFLRKTLHHLVHGPLERPETEIRIGLVLGGQGIHKFESLAVVLDNGQDGIVLGRPGMVAVMWLTFVLSPSLDVDPLGESSLSMKVKQLDDLVAVGLVICYEYRFHLFVCFIRQTLAPAVNFLAFLFSWRVANTQYTAGISTRVINVENERPQQTVIPKERHISEPSPLPKAMGNIPRTVVSVVMRIGLNRLLAAVTEALMTFIPLSRMSIV